MPPRTPADIGRDIAAAEQRIRDLKAELSDAPPSVLELAPQTGVGTFCFHGRGETAIEFTRLGDGGRLYKYVGRADFESLRDWLNYYFLKEA